MSTLSFRVYYADTDAGGIVYHANYLAFCERGRTEFLRSIGFEHKYLREHEGLMFVVRHIEADYLATAILDDLLDITTSIAELGKTRIVMKQTVRRGDKVLFEMKVTLVCINMEGRPIRPPEALIGAFMKTMEQE